MFENTFCGPNDQKLTLTLALQHLVLTSGVARCDLDNFKLHLSSVVCKQTHSHDPYKLWGTLGSTICFHTLWEYSCLFSVCLAHRLVPSLFFNGYGGCCVKRTKKKKEKDSCRGTFTLLTAPQRLSDEKTKHHPASHTKPFTVSAGGNCSSMRDI